MIEQIFPVRYDELDAHAHIPAAAFLKYFQQAAAQDSAQLGFGWKDLIKDNLAWILTHMQARALQADIPLQDVTVKTWHVFSDRLLSRRQFVVYGQDKTPLFEGSSWWAIMDIQKRRLTRTPQRLLDGHEALPVDLEPEENFKAPLPADAPASTLEILTREEDLDLNAHVNNTHYAAWAIQSVPLAAREGNAQAQTELGRFYEQGLGGLPSSRGEALNWYLQAGQQGDAQAQERAQDVQLEDPQLYEEVTRFQALLASAKTGDSQAQLEVGQMLREGYVIAQNNEEAARWFTQAWQEGEKLPQAAYELSQLYQNGEGVEKNEAKAMELLGAAAQAKNPDAQYQMGTLAYGANPPKYEDAFAWFSNAAAGGQAQGQYMTGFMLMQGQGTPKSVELAIQFFRKAAEQNHTAAQYVLGQIYWKGLGVPANKKEGEQWLRRAADSGNEASRSRSRVVLR